ncbi:TetR/AcrR family transcriptional regulator [Ramlibacter sp.]|uniref:TetR/AcrR family transcriptional regulator n=1 Tax=Ramlibacter sp. TaxID=1917967 RepID=UPI0017BBE2DD|nr:TetR/AcrR family transcriptional regulator [Ramlibacter sp.]MBA2673323.1 TetR/AcrR family transcriptional regulator [Ramlibacter sp.]
MEARTQKSELTRAAIVGAALDVALEQGLEALSLQSVADRVGLSKSGVFSRVGSREALQVATIEEFSRRFIAEVFAPAMQQPKGLPRMDEIMRRWIRHTRDVEVHRGCLYCAGAFELDDREGPLRDALYADVLRWRAALRRTVLQCMEQGHLRAGTSPEQVVAEVNALILGLLYDARFLRDSHAADRAETAWQRIRQSYLA